MLDPLTVLNSLLLLTTLLCAWRGYRGQNSRNLSSRSPLTAEPAPDPVGQEAPASDPHAESETPVLILASSRGGTACYSWGR